MRKKYPLIYRRYAENFKYIIMGLCVLIITFVLPKQARFRFEYDKGKIWMQKDLISPYRFAIQKTSNEIEKDQQDALQSVSPVYQNNPTIVAKAIADFESDIEVKWKNTLINGWQKNIYKSAGDSLLSSIYRRGVVLPIKKTQQPYSNYAFIVLTDNVAQQLHINDVYTVPTGLKYAEYVISQNKAIENKVWLLGLIENHLQPNYTYDDHLTEKLQSDAMATVSTTRGVVQKGELIVAHGTIVNDEIYQKMESLRSAFEDNANIEGNRNVALFGQFLLVGLAVALLVVFLYLFRKDLYDDNRKLLLILLIVTCMLVVLSWCIRIKIPSVYYIPYCIVPIIIRILFDTRLALNIHLLVVLIAG